MLVTYTDKCPQCHCLIKTIHSIDWQKEGINPKIIPDNGVPARYEEGHLCVKLASRP